MTVSMKMTGLVLTGNFERTTDLAANLKEANQSQTASGFSNKENSQKQITVINELMSNDSQKL